MSEIRPNYGVFKKSMPSWLHLVKFCNFSIVGVQVVPKYDVFQSISLKIRFRKNSVSWKPLKILFQLAEFRHETARPDLLDLRERLDPPETLDPMAHPENRARRESSSRSSSNPHPRSASRYPLNIIPTVTRLPYYSAPPDLQDPQARKDAKDHRDTMECPASEDHLEA